MYSKHKITDLGKIIIFFVEMDKESVWLAVPRLQYLVTHAIVCAHHYQENMPSWNAIICKKLEETNILKPENTIRVHQPTCHACWYFLNSTESMCA